MTLRQAAQTAVRVTSSTWFLSLAAVLLVAGLTWRTVRPTGEWDDTLPGHRFESVQLTDYTDRTFPLAHPSVVYFYTEDCEHCGLAGQRLKRFVQRHAGETVPVYAITSLGRMPRAVVDALAPAITPVMLAQPNGSMNVVRAVPLTVRTDPKGAIARAWVGIPDEDQLRRLVVR